MPSHAEASRAFPEIHRAAGGATTSDLVSPQRGSGVPSEIFLITGRVRFGRIREGLLMMH